MSNSNQQEYSLDKNKLLDSAARLLHQYLIQPPKPEAKKRFKKLLNAEQPLAAKMEGKDGTTINFILKLDHSEFQGKLFFSNFSKHLTLLINSIGQALEKNEDIGLRQQADRRSFLYTHPSAIETDGQLNLLLLGLDLETPGEITLELLFFEPTQFEQQQ